MNTSNNNFKTLRLFLLFLSVLAIPVVVYLSQRTQELRQQAATHPILFGLSPSRSDYAGKPAAWQETQLQLGQQACSKVIRLGLDWAQVEPNAPVNGMHSYNFAPFDAIINSANAKGMEVIGLIVSAPPWANGGHGDAGLWPHLSQFNADYDAYLQATVNRYHGKVKQYEIWNEANGCGWHTGCGGDKNQKVAEYLPVLKQTYMTIKSIDASIPISTTGTDGADTEFLNILYQQSTGSNLCSGHVCWDAVAVHPYGTNDIDFNGLTNVHNLMVSKGDGSKPVWITEFGWNTTDEASKVNSMNNTLNRLASSEFSFVNLATYLIMADYPDVPHFGVLNNDLSIKASYDAFKAFSCGGSIPQPSNTPLPGAPTAIPPTGGNIMLPLGSCTEVAEGSYSILPAPDPGNPGSYNVKYQHPDRSSSHPMSQRANEHADYNLSVRGWTTSSDNRKFLISSGGSLRDSNGNIRPLLSTLLPSQTYITANYSVYDWKWPTETADPTHAQLGTKGSPIGTQPVTLIGLAAQPGEKIRLPFSNYDLGSGYGGMVIYAKSNSITLKYTREDNVAGVNTVTGQVVGGYTIHIDGISVNPNLLSLYNIWNNRADSTARTQLPVIKPCQVIGTSIGNEIRVAVRDVGAFLDPRWAEDWWGIIAPTAPPVVNSPTPVGGGATAVPTATPVPTRIPLPTGIPNCTFPAGQPTTIRLGSTATYTAQYSAPIQVSGTSGLSGFISAMSSTNQTPTNTGTWVNQQEWSPNFATPLYAPSGSLSFNWTPTKPGSYLVFCRSWNTTVNPQMECRGLDTAVDAPPRYVCPGPGSVITVNVTSATLPPPDSTQPDMCQFAQTFSGSVLLPNHPLTIAAVAQSNYNIVQYTFEFLNMDNSSGKQIAFNGKPYIIDSPQNTITVKFDDFNRPDTNNGNQIPANIKVQAYFTDSNGTTSTPSLACAQYFTLLNPTSTPIPTAEPTAMTSAGPVNYGAIVAIMGVLVVVIIVSLNFFFGS